MCRARRWRRGGRRHTSRQAVLYLDLQQRSNSNFFRIRSPPEQRQPKKKHRTQTLILTLMFVLVFLFHSVELYPFKSSEITKKITKHHWGALCSGWITRTCRAPGDPAVGLIQDSKKDLKLPGGGDEGPSLLATIHVPFSFFSE